MDHHAERGDLAAALAEGSQGARRGHQLALASITHTESAIDATARSLEHAITELEGSRVETSDVVSKLRDQWLQIINDLTAKKQEAWAALEAAESALDEFSITLFGRTMAGKSTLMEILIRGRGDSIGRGGQRTTRDVRVYHWRGLKVTDVPGIGDSEGTEDQERALAAARQADLVLFVITDDAPQPIEAECLARVRSFGKPIVGILNVKRGFQDQDDIADFLRAPEKIIDRDRLRDLVDQFHAFADSHHPGNRIAFVYNHLHARFLAGRTGDRQQCRALRKASQFVRVEERILDQIRRRA